MFQFCSTSQATRTTLSRACKQFDHLFKPRRSEELETEVGMVLHEMPRWFETRIMIKSGMNQFKLKSVIGISQFNYSVANNIMYLMKERVLDVVDEGAYLIAAAPLQNIISDTVTKPVTVGWSQLYVYPPDVLHVNRR